MEGRDSKDTSMNQLPAGIKYLVQNKLCNNNINLDYGCGKYQKASVYLYQNGIINYEYDPYHRTEKHNKYILERCKNNGFAGSVTILNVLNVIPTKEERIKVIKHALSYMKYDGVMIIGVYEKNKDGVLEKTTKGWQNNQPLEFYLNEIKENFDINIKKDGKYIILTI